ncbi:MAG: hypothetical protein M1828_005595 [Chrysothrix sp. TS-e1954]|nr:MAG: hypothetical protein M1828_005595 [Chrysothrix sp. TS-e1954]
MPSDSLGKRKRGASHPYLSGNFAPTQQTCSLTPCQYTGTIPAELSGGQYVRNGGNPVSNEDLGRDAHWFDGDGMLSGVSFESDSDGTFEPRFVNQYILTDLYLSTLSTPSLRRPIAPSISTLVNPLSSLLKICLAIFRTVLLVILSHLPGSQQAIKKISVANTAIMYHDGRVLATCESGPPMRVQLPSLETVGWYNGQRAEGEPETGIKTGAEFGGDGLIGWMKEWTTAHPKVDPTTNEMILFHSTFIPPYVHYSIVPAEKTTSEKMPPPTRLTNAPVSGVSSAKMMHDFGVSTQNTVIMDLPLTLDPLKLAKNQPPITYDSSKPSRFGVFPRHEPSNVRWFETSACCIFHTANTWDVVDNNGIVESVDMIACRMTSATFVFSAGNISAPQPTHNTVSEVTKNNPQRVEEVIEDRLEKSYEKGPLLESTKIEEELAKRGMTREDAPGLNFREEDHCGLHYYSFSMDKASGKNEISHEFGLSKVSLEFPSVAPAKAMSSARFVYGCTSLTTTFNASLGRSAKIDGLVKIDTGTLIARGKANPPQSGRSVDDRTGLQVVACASSNVSDDPIAIFCPPHGTYLQEPRFVPTSSGTAEDDGFLLSYAFDEAQLTDDGEAPPSSVSELWIIDARGMRDVLAKINLPQRVPYGMHGGWFPQTQIAGQRPVQKTRKIRDEAQKDSRLIARASQRMVDNLVWVIGG